MVDESAQRAGEQLQQSVHEDINELMNELTRMLRQQGDAANELAETFGRSLIRLSEAVEELRCRLDRMETGGDRPTHPR